MVKSSEESSFLEIHILHSDLNYQIQLIDDIKMQLEQLKIELETIMQELNIEF